MNNNIQRKSEELFDQSLSASHEEPVEANTEDSMNVTLLELVKAVTEVSESEQEVIATVAHMLDSGSIKLRGCLRNESLDLQAVSP